MDIKGIFKDFTGRFIDKTNRNAKDVQTALTIIIILLLNVAIYNLNVRIDLTSSRSYSLSDKSKDTVRGLKERLTIKVFFSKDLPPELAAVSRYVKDLLQEYGYYGSGNFRYEFVKQENLEKEASDYGIQPVTSRELASDQVKLKTSYMALVIQHADLIEKIGAITDTAGLEYEITSLMDRMTAKNNSLLKLDKPISVKLFIDGRLKQLPIDGINTIEQKVKDAVSKSSKQNYDKLKLDIIDPSITKTDVDPIAQYGLGKVKWQAGKTSDGRNLAAGEGVLGLIIETGGEFTTVPINILPTILGTYGIAGLENLDSKINDAVGTLLASYAKIGYVTGHGEVDINDDRSPDGGGLFKKLVSDSHELVPLNLLSDDIPSDMNLLIVNGPKQSLTDYELYRIDQFLMKGKSVMFFVDSFTELNMGNQNMYGQPIVLPVQTGLDPLLAHFGATVGKDIVLDKNCAKANMGNMIIDYPVVPIIAKSSLSSESPITKYIKGLALIRNSSVTVDNDRVKAAKGSALNLVSSSNESWAMLGNINFNPMMLQQATGELKSFPLAVQVSGSFDSFFKGKPEPEKGKDKKAGAKGNITSALRLDSTVTSAKSQIIVVGSSEITKSGFIMDSAKILAGGAAGNRVELYPNSLLLRNMIDVLLGNSFAPEMRAKSLSHNPLAKSSENKRFAVKAINMAGVPLLVVIAGIVVWRLRLVRRRSIMNKYSTEAKNEKQA